MEGQQNGRKRGKIIDEMDSDRISYLPNHIIYHVLSPMDTKHAVQTCVLSKKWKRHWTPIHSLGFDDKSFKGKIKFGKFVRRVLRKRRPFNLCRLRFCSRGDRASAAAERILNYAKSKNVEELDTNSDILRVHSFDILSASLTTLHLSRVYLYFPKQKNHIFSSCLNLESLILNGCNLDFLEVLEMSAARLVNLTISSLKYRHVEEMKIVISAPRLKSFDFNGMCLLLLVIDERCKFICNTH